MKLLHIILLSICLALAISCKPNDTSKKTPDSTIKQSDDDDNNDDDTGEEYSDENFVTTSEYVDLGSNVDDSVKGLNYQHCLLDPKGFSVTYYDEKDSPETKEDQDHLILRIEPGVLPKSGKKISVGNDIENYVSVKRKKQSDAAWTTMQGGSCVFDVGQAKTISKTLNGVPLFEVDAEITCNDLPNPLISKKLDFTVPVDCVGMDMSNAE